MFTLWNAFSISAISSSFFEAISGIEYFFPANEILAKQQELVAEYNAKQYQRDRAKAYPSIQEQLDMQYWDSVNGTTTWQDAIETIKNKYPKP